MSLFKLPLGGSLHLPLLILTILLAVFSSRKFTGRYKSHEVASFVILVLCFKVRLCATDCRFVLMMNLSSQLLSRKKRCHLQNTSYSSANIGLHGLGKGLKNRENLIWYFDRKVLRKLSGLVLENGWRWCKNFETQKFYYEYSTDYCTYVEDGRK